MIVVVLRLLVPCTGRRQQLLTFGGIHRTPLLGALTSVPGICPWFTFSFGKDKPVNNLRSLSIAVPVCVYCAPLLFHLSVTLCTGL